MKPKSLFTFLIVVFIIGLTFISTTQIWAQDTTEKSFQSFIEETKDINTNNEVNLPEDFEDYFPANQFLNAKKNGMYIMLTWFILVVLYYIWAIWYYNVNLGYTTKAWKEIKKRVKDALSRQAAGEPVDESELEEPFDNPYQDETLGLPPGTVRSTIALTLTIGALVMLYISFYAPEGINFSSRFEYYITAFEMMIAFYFGSRAISMFKTDEGKKHGLSAPLGKAPKDRGAVG